MRGWLALSLLFLSLPVSAQEPALPASDPAQTTAHPTQIAVPPVAVTAPAVTPAAPIVHSSRETTTYGADKVRLDVPVGVTAQPQQQGSVKEEPMVRRGMYDRPYLLRIGSASTDVALGGYFELVGSYLQQNGVSDGFTAEARRFNIFLTSKIADRLRLTSELEFEHGTQGIGLETAALDVLLHHGFNLRGGIVLVPIGKFNIAHDAPLYDVIDRPLVSTLIIPATLSEVGGGIFGALYPGGHKLTYEAYVINGLTDGVVAAEGTRIAAGKQGPRFQKDNNGQPAVSARLGYALPPRRLFRLETALSFYSGTYNTFAADGLTLDDPRWLHILAYDLEASLGPVTVRGELAYARIDLPSSLTERHGAEQLGLYCEAIGTFLQRKLLVFPRAALAAVARLDWVDLNRSSRPSGEPLGDETTRLTVGLSFRPAPGTSLRVGYRYEWITDLLGNPVRGGGFQLGMASYF